MSREAEDERMAARSLRQAQGIIETLQKYHQEALEEGVDYRESLVIMTTALVEAIAMVLFRAEQRGMLLCPAERLAGDVEEWVRTALRALKEAE